MKVAEVHVQAVCLSLKKKKAGVEALKGAVPVARWQVSKHI